MLDSSLHSSRYMLRSSRSTPILLLSLVLLLSTPVVNGQLGSSDTSTSSSSISSIESRLTSTESLAKGAGEAVDAAWIYSTAFLIFFMQAGFALLEAGAVGSKDIIAILLKNFTDFGISSICYWLIGAGVHHGGTPFLGLGEDHGSTHWFATSEPTLMPKLLQATMFCATAVTIVSGAIACRFSFHAYMILCIIFSSLIYPVTASWVWGSGFLSPTSLGAIDFAGSGIVHLQGATIAMTACLFVGPRLGRFIVDPHTGKLTPSSDFTGNSIVLTALGTLILFFGWFGFNAGSSGGLTGGRHLSAGIASVNTVLAGSSALLTGLFLTRFMVKTYNFWDVLNSTLAGLVAVTAGCATMGPPPAIGVGVIAAFTYHFTNKFILSRGIDDVVGAFSVHGTPGAIGLLAAGLFSRRDYIDLAYGVGVLDYRVGRQFGIQLLLTICILTWSGLSSSLVLWLLSRTIGVRVSQDDEIVGLDFKYQKGYAYETHNKRMLRAKKQIEREQILGQKMRMAVGGGGGGGVMMGEHSKLGGRPNTLYDMNDNIGVGNGVSAIDLSSHETPTCGTAGYGGMQDRDGSIHPAGSCAPDPMDAIREGENSVQSEFALSCSHHTDGSHVSAGGGHRHRSPIRLSMNALTRQPVYIGPAMTTTTTNQWKRVPTNNDNHSYHNDVNVTNNNPGNNNLSLDEARLSHSMPVGVGCRTSHAHVVDESRSCHPAASSHLQGSSAFGGVISSPIHSPPPHVLSPYPLQQPSTLPTYQPQPITSSTLADEHILIVDSNTAHDDPTHDNDPTSFDTREYTMVPSDTRHDSRLARHDSDSLSHHTHHGPTFHADHSTLMTPSPTMQPTPNAAANNTHTNSSPLPNHSPSTGVVTMPSPLFQFRFNINNVTTTHNATTSLAHNH